jgi:cytochrome c oxidase subunit 2
MDKYELRTIILSGTLLAVFFFAVLYNSYSRRIDMPTCIPFDKTFEKSEVKKIDEGLYEVHLVARMWTFDPEEIEIPVGATVDFYLTSKDVVHGFHINEKGVNMMAVPGAINKIVTKFEETGTYRFVCNEFCGAGHQNMMGKIIVK